MFKNWVDQGFVGIVLVASYLASIHLVSSHLEKQSQEKRPSQAMVGLIQLPERSAESAEKPPVTEKKTAARLTSSIPE